MGDSSLVNEFPVYIKYGVHCYASDNVPFLQNIMFKVCIYHIPTSFT